MSKVEVVSYGKYGRKEGNFIYPTDIHVYEDKLFVLDPYNNRVQIFRIKSDGFEYINSIKTYTDYPDKTYMESPQHITIDQNGQLYISESIINIHAYDQNGILVKTHDILHNDFAINDSGHLVCTNLLESKVLIYQNNEIIRSCDLISPNLITINNNQRILVNYKLSLIKVFDNNLNELFDIKNDESVYSLCGHQSGKILLSSKDEIKILESNGDEIFVCWNGKFNYLKGIASYGEDIIVSDRNNHCIHVIKNVFKYIPEKID